MEINLIPYSPLLQWPPTTSHVSPHIILQHNNTLNTMNFQLRATAPMLSMWPCKLKLDEEKSNHAGLAQQNAFGPAFLHSLTRLIKCTAKLLAPTRKEWMNMIWLLLPVSDWPIIMIGLDVLLLVVSHLFAVPVLVYGCGWKIKIKRLRYEKNIFAGSHPEHRWRCF